MEYIDQICRWYVYLKVIEMIFGWLVLSIIFYGFYWIWKDDKKIL
jgi:hypothetical protein